jgi:hypothetical protein
MLFAYWVSLARTVAPLIAGWVIAQGVRVGVDIDSALVVSLVAGGATAAYYAVFRWAEQRLSARWGWLLGWARPPEYPGAPAAGR